MILLNFNFRNIISIFYVHKFDENTLEMFGIRWKIAFELKTILQNLIKSFAQQMQNKFNLLDIFVQRLTNLLLTFFIDAKSTNNCRIFDMFDLFVCHFWVVIEMLFSIIWLLVCEKQFNKIHGGNNSILTIEGTCRVSGWLNVLGSLDKRNSLGNPFFSIENNVKRLTIYVFRMNWRGQAASCAQLSHKNIIAA